ASFGRWILDLASPKVVRMLQRKMGRRLREADARLMFGPADGPGFFRPYGWRADNVKSLLHSAAELGRLPLWLRLITKLAVPQRPSASRPWSGVCLMVKE